MQADLLALKERVNLLETENTTLKTQMAALSTAPQVNPDQVKALEEKIQTSTKSWADMLKNSEGKNTMVVSQAMQEQSKRDSKAQNVRVRGFSLETDPLLAAKELLASLSYEEDVVEAAWRSKFDTSVIFIRFKYADYREEALKRRGRLKGSNIFVHEDLTALQWKERKQLIEEANSKGKKVIFRNGRHFYVTPSTTDHSASPPA